MEVTYSQEFTQLSLVLRYRIPENCFNLFTVCLYSLIRNNMAEKFNTSITNGREESVVKQHNLIERCYIQM
jgi:hypothetical protein